MARKQGDLIPVGEALAGLAGLALSAWLPGGWRNIIMLVIVVFAVLGGVLVHWYWGFLLLLATIFSPRLVGEVAFFLAH